MDENADAGDPADEARRIAIDPALPAWATQARDELLDGNVQTLETLERLHTAAPWLYDKGREWLTAT